MLNIRNQKVTNPTRSLLLSFYMRTWVCFGPFWWGCERCWHWNSVCEVQDIHRTRELWWDWLWYWKVCACTLHLHGSNLELLSKCTGTVGCTTLTSMARWVQDKTLHDCQTSKWVVKMGASSSAVFCGQPTWDEKIPSWVDRCRLNMRRDIITTERLHIRGECSHERSQTNGFGF